MLIGAAMLANAVGDVIWQILLLRGDEPLGISAADPAYLATYPLLLAGVWRLVSATNPHPPTAPTRQRSLKYHLSGGRAPPGKKFLTTAANRAFRWL